MLNLSFSVDKDTNKSNIKDINLPEKQNKKHDGNTIFQSIKKKVGNYRSE